MISPSGMTLNKTLSNQMSSNRLSGEKNQLEGYNIKKINSSNASTFKFDMNNLNNEEFEQERTNVRNDISDIIS